ncbi:MAG: HlyD family efflux transporter periplasmic adaptor subunit [Rhodanobacteraceae bacterium]|nr:HlyD family efflux transporter periplasmic adaptor subunit [Rhodanobacteraceae bacterium]MBL0040417.1 HlyD family efflux transporter periplasmic adaptor subunit [Xanthomonadales bacterium]
MRNVERCAPALLLWVLCCSSVFANPTSRVILSGEVVAMNAQPVYCPPSNTSPVVLRYYVSEGSAVKRGDVVVRIDAGASAAMIQTLTAQIEQTEARAAQEIATLTVAAIDAERAWVDADALFRKARVDAAIPKQHLSALDYDRYQGEQVRTERDLALRLKERDAASAAVTRRREDARLEIDKLHQDLLYNQAQVALAEVKAEVDGVVVHGFNPWRGDRFDEGSSAWPGMKVGEIVDRGPMTIKAYALEADRSALAVGQKVHLRFDARPDLKLDATISAISGAPAAKMEMGAGRYFTVTIPLENSADLGLLPASSVRVESVPAAPDAATKGAQS